MEKRRILAYGDSLTWGYIPGSGERFPEDIRWTGVCQKILGDAYTVIEDGLIGRTTVYDTGRNPYQNGRTGLGIALLSQKPLDLVVLFLGTNDLEFMNAGSIATGMDELVRLTRNANYVYRTDQPIFYQEPKVLVIAPPLFHPQLDQLMPGSTVAGRTGEMKKVASLYQAVASKRGAGFLDASLYAEASPADCCHITAESQQRLGKAIAEKIVSMMTV